MKTLCLKAQFAREFELGVQRSMASQRSRQIGQQGGGLSYENET